MMKRVGIVVPSYNQGKYLERAIQSIILSKKHIDISLVVIDGGSTDDSTKIIKKYEKEIEFWQSKKDNGQAAAVNIGINHIRQCDYIMWLNSDDEFDNEYSVSKLADYMERNNYKVCYGKSYLINESGKKIGEYATEQFDRKKLRKACFISQPSVMVEYRTWMKETGLDERLSMCLDYELWLRLSEKYEFGYLEEFIGNTRIYAQTKSSTMQERHLDEAITVLYKRYGEVPVVWIYNKFMLKKQRSMLEKVPARFIKLGLFPFKRMFIQDSIKKCEYSLLREK